MSRVDDANDVHKNCKNGYLVFRHYFLFPNSGLDCDD